MTARDLTVRTLDNVELRVDAVLTFSISDPIKAIRGVKDLFDLLRQRMETTLNNIFAHNNYGAAQKKNSGVRTAAPVTDAVAAEGAGDGARAEAFRRANEFISEKDQKGDMASVVHDEFMSAIKSTAADRWGVDIGDLSIDNLKVVNEDLAHDLEQRAVTTVKTATARANAENASKIGLIQADALARSKALEAQGDTSKAVVTAKAEAEITRANAAAAAEATRIAAEAEAKATLIMAKAKADARVLEAEAEKKAMELEAQAMECLGDNAMHKRQWQTQLEIAAAMFANQRTFVDTSAMPSMADMLNLNLMSGLTAAVQEGGKQKQKKAAAMNGNGIVD